MVMFNGHPMSQGGWVSASNMYRVIGHFRGIEQKRYLLEVELLDDITALSKAKPRIAIHVPSLDAEGEAISAALLAITGIFTFLVGAAWLAFAFFRHRH